jgi:hypothetical protein
MFPNSFSAEQAKLTHLSVQICDVIVLAVNPHRSDSLTHRGGVMLAHFRVRFE